MEEVIKESDLIQLDGTIDKLIKQLTELNAAYGSTVEAMKLGAESIVRSLKSASGATAEGRKAIDNAAVAVNRYERAMYELEFAMSETGKQVAWLKEQTREVNRVTIDQRKQLEAAAGSYDKIKAEVKELTALYKSLSEAERNEASFGQEIVAELQAKNAQLKELEKAIKPVVEQMTRLQKAEQELAYWQSEEGQKLLEVKKQIREITSARKEEKATVDPLAAAQEKLAKARSDENEQLKVLALQTKQANTEAQLKAKLAIAEKGSYNELAATYDLVKFKMKGLNVTTAEGAAELERLQEQARQMYAEMRRFQEATGVYTLGVGDYASSWGGLGFSVQQVVRELPAATVSLNTFFLAISNNIPILVDEINKTRLANKQMLAEGKQTVPVSKQIVKALFSWQSALVIVLTVLSMYGKQMIEWVGNLFKGKNAALELGKALKNIAEEMENTNDNYGQNMITFRKLREEYSELKTEAEKTKWIEDNEDAFKQLNIAIYDSADAERLLIENTENVKKAFQDRARAAAAYKITQEKYEELLLAEESRKLAETTGVTLEDRRKAGLGADPNYSEANAMQAFNTRIEGMKAEETRIQQEIDLYYELGRAAQVAADSITGTYENQDGGSSRTQKLRDLTDYINNMKLRTTERYEKAITNLEKNEFEKRRKEANKAYTTGVIELQNMYDKNERILKDEDDKYKDLTDEQLATVKAAQSRILATLNNLKSEYNQTLEEIALDERVSELEILNESLNLRLEATKKGSEEEFKLRKQLVENERELAIQRNKVLIPEYRQAEVDINTKYDKMIEDLAYEHQLELLSIEEEGLQLRLESTRAGSEEEMRLQLRLIEKQRAIALMQNRMLPSNQQMSEADINASFDKKGFSVVANYSMNTFDQEQALAAAKFNIRENTEREITVFTLEQEKARWQKQIELAEAGTLDWSQAQIDAAKAAVEGIDKELDKLTGFEGFIGQVADKGLTGGILEALGFDNDAIDAFQQAVDVVIDNLGEILAAETELAEAAVEAAEERVEAAQSAYDAEIEARNNGYANSVETARKELEEERRNQAEKERILAEAQKRQERLNTITQSSSLITAAAQLWSTMSAIPVVGPGLAIAAIATMFGSFIAARVKANQLASQAYGEGGLEFLEGGSHASGNDIDLGINNSKNRRMRAEGGEAIAIINRRNTKRYKDILPCVIESFNDGTFQDKYANAFSIPEEQRISINQGNYIDLSTLEDDVRNIRKNNETRYYTTPDGTVIMQYKNLKRIIKN